MSHTNHLMIEYRLLYLGLPALMKDVHQNFYPACLHYPRCPGIFVVEYSLRSRISGNRLISGEEMCKPLTTDLEGDAAL